MSYLFDGPMRVAQNPARAEAELDKAVQLFETFAGSKPRRTERQRIERVVPDVLVDLGTLRGLIYAKTHEAGAERPRTYIHFMEDPPRLMCDADGRRLFIVGGSYRITRRGIEG
jgi:hypothetical protein